MSASKYFKRLYTKDNLKNYYYNSIRYNSATGIDKINTRIFEKSLDENIEIIIRKVFSGVYNFSQYRQKLISRGEDRFPRVISIPTIRDKITLKALHEILKNVFLDVSTGLHTTVFNVSDLYKQNIYNGFIRLDIKDFYPSIDHDIISSKIRSKIKKREILELINNCLTKNTVSKPSKENIQKSCCGVPQGLSISNILANIYLQNIDSKYKCFKNLSYNRYVDDILILCKYNDIESIKNDLIFDFNSIKLSVYDLDEEKTKSSWGNISDGFTYLGYSFQAAKVSVRDESLNKIREIIIKLLTRYKYSEEKDTRYLKWAINLKITGFVFDNTRYGWMFYFSQIDNIDILHSLDHFVKKQIKRFNINYNSLQIKKFVRTYREIKFNLDNTNYIPNFDNLNISDKRIILTDIFDIKIELMETSEIEYEFNKRIYKLIKEVEKDLSRPS